MVIGPPASGKTTIAKLVANKLHLAGHLTPENLVTDDETGLKYEAENFLKKKQVRTRFHGKVQS